MTQPANMCGIRIHGTSARLADNAMKPINKAFSSLEFSFLSLFLTDFIPCSAPTSPTHTPLSSSSVWLSHSDLLDDKGNFYSPNLFVVPLHHPRSVSAMRIRSPSVPPPGRRTDGEQRISATYRGNVGGSGVFQRRCFS
ncbi:hypothetical protein KP509_17G007100 [Ceratopteris richardii]|uniref:Uncharacterized protein n=1 Tax=Ceratopteris richardii TaxID=49495 RepID=A0A8T2SU50_CERRI|nr:hypothetical protein KP509_17G007100 [Ceratopteris richardii]